MGDDRAIRKKGYFYMSPLPNSPMPPEMPHESCPMAPSRLVHLSSTRTKQVEERKWKAPPSTHTTLTRKDANRRDKQWPALTKMTLASHTSADPVCCCTSSAPPARRLLALRSEATHVPETVQRVATATATATAALAPILVPWAPLCRICIRRIGSRNQVTARALSASGIQRPCFTSPRAPCTSRHEQPRHAKPPYTHLASRHSPRAASAAVLACSSCSLARNAFLASSLALLPFDPDCGAPPISSLAA